jgi:NAD-dependent DNA ligase
VPNIGEITARQILEGLSIHRGLILELEKILSIKNFSDGPLKGKTFCITGDLSKPRKTVEKMISDAGGVSKGSVSKDTTYLITNNPTTTSSKMKKAKQHGVTVITEEKLYSMLGVVG